ncbi:MAG: cold shock domain-containing protein [bacterium]|nr:cold shock domain-containing protein [bacterium]
MTGKIKKLVKERKFGFIAREGEADLFFHTKDLQGVTFEELNEGDELSFEIGQTEKGPNATNVTRA